MGTIFAAHLPYGRLVATLLDGSNVRLNWNIESDMNVHWIKFKHFLSLYWFKNKQ